ncbi:MAG: hypothetical protein M5R40_20675 [Anaerolineae bacterium]|nr:hypothetical protein [Anaerolineae bacterium]
MWARPTPADLWALQGPLLAADTPPARAAHALAGAFYAYLGTLQAKLSAHRYSQLAAMLEAGAVTVIGMGDTLAGGRLDLRELFVAGLGGALEVMAATQNVKAWAVDTRSADLEVAWGLYGALWDLSTEMQPELEPEARAAHLDALLTPLTAPETPEAARAALIIRLFQVVLTVRVLAALAASTGEAPTPA